MRKIVKYATILLAALSLVLLVGGAVLVATWDPNDYKSVIVQFVKDKSQRTLSIPGRLKLSVLPKLGVEFDAATLTERGAPALFASIAGAKVSVALLPLLQKRLVLDQITLTGLRATLRRFADGSTNFDDLLAKPAGPRQFEFDIAGLEVRQAEVDLYDAMTATTLALKQIELKTGRLAERVATSYEAAFRILDPGAKIDAQFRSQGGMMFDLDAKHYEFTRTQSSVEGAIGEWRNVKLSLATDFDVKPALGGYALTSAVLQARGERGRDSTEFSVQAAKIALSGSAVSGEPLTGKASALQGERNIEASFRLPAVAGSVETLRVNPLAVDWKLAQKNLQAAGTSTADVTINVKTGLYQAVGLTSSATVKQGSTDLVASMGGTIILDARAQALAANELVLEVSGKAGVETVTGRVAGALTANLATQLYRGKLASLDFSVGEKTARRAGRFTCAVSADLSSEVVTLDALAGDLTLSDPALRGGSLSGTVHGNAVANLAKESFAAKLNLTVRQSAIAVDVKMQGLAEPEYSFDIAADRLDLDSLLAAKPVAAGPLPRPEAGAEKMDPFARLRALNADGVLRVGKLKSGDNIATNVRIEVKSKNH